jgi:uncharacterized membrane protein YoaK (UPF0700 family)
VTYGIGLIVSIVCAVACNRIATSKGRGPVLWAILGFFFTIIALIIIALLPRRSIV